MIGASTLSGDTLIACHFPVVQLPTWELPVQSLCSSSKRPSRLCSVGLTRAVSLPEKDSLNREHSFTGGRRHFSSSYGSLNEDRVEEEGGSDSSGRYDSTSSPEEVSSQPKKRTSRHGGNLRSHNSFVPKTELDEDEDDEDSDGGNLHRYHEDSSFVLHGNSNWPVYNDDRIYAMPHGNVDSDWGGEGTMLGPESDRAWLPNMHHQLDSLKSGGSCFNGSRSGIEADGEQNLDGLKENLSNCTPELFNSHPEYVSDSSCNSSDGILVNFCTMYNGSNNPATPHDLSSPAVHPRQSSEESVFLNLQPFSKTPDKDSQHGGMTVNSSPKQEVDMTPSASCWSPHGLDSNCNFYSLDPLPAALSSLEVSDLTGRLQSQVTLAIGTNQKYYKLVTCDLSSKSPSPAYSSVTSCLDDQNRSSPIPVSEQLFVNDKTGQHKDVTKEKKLEKSFSADCAASFEHRFQSSNHRVAAASAERICCNLKHAPSIQNVAPTPSRLGQCSPRSVKIQDTRITTTQPTLILDQGHADVGEGACSLENAVVRYSKAQRPTSLPIQPFVLVPAGKPQTQHLGCLLERYMTQKSSKSASSQSGFKFKGKRSQCFSNLQVSPMGSHYPVFLEAPSSSDTCSTCTPSPDCFSRRHTWSQSSRSQGRSSPRMSKSSLDTTSKSHAEPRNDNQANASHCSPLSLSPPTLTLTADANLQASPSKTAQSEKQSSQDRAAPAADSRFFHNGFTAALFSVAPLSTLSSLLSSAASGLQIQDFTGLGGKTSVSHCDSLILSDNPPTEFCLSPDTSYDSMSISHLQRRGLLRSVNRAVDLIVAHFGSSRDPEEKMRLGNSSRSPTIAGLVLEHLCPAVQNVLEDGLRDHKLDLIVGQQRNHSWSVVEVSTKISPSTRVLHSLVSKITLFPQLSCPGMRLRAFIMGLLNLRALEFWLSHLQSLKDVVSAYYHSWGFLCMSRGQCQPMFQELLLLLQPLSVMPFDLNLLLEPRLLENRQLCSGEDGAFSPSPCSAHLVTSWPLLQADKMIVIDRSGQSVTSPTVRFHQEKWKEDCHRVQAGGGHSLAPIPEWWPMESDLIGVVEEKRSADNWSQISSHQRQEERKKEAHKPPDASPFVPDGSPWQGWPRWANLFGAGSTFTRTKRASQSHIGSQTRRYKLPSQWLHLNCSQLGVLAQSIRSMKLSGAQAGEAS